MPRGQGVLDEEVELVPDDVHEPVEVVDDPPAEELEDVLEDAPVDEPEDG